MPSFFIPTPGHLDGLFVPTPGNLPILKKKKISPGVSPGGGWALLELTDALLFECYYRKLSAVQYTGTPKTLSVIKKMLCYLPLSVSVLSRLEGI